ncbi:cysteine--tRNA ligase [Candidatus Woesearchaeota archaeon CG10_big_fil_rev_8_21_14_0_10_32_9]|nr:MAG: cysteine--tRNA ligase [Candidatus Woesearchaeota archaeon CG10_big_fil_rev_8_21_14_0_10_32_9]
MVKVSKFFLFNTLNREVEELKPIHEGKISMYTCGPTVYGRAHIGNMRTYINSDVLKRALIFAGYEVLQVMNVTDVGHLTSDSDEGDDKLQMSAKKEKVSSWDVAKKYTDYFFEDEKELNIIRPSIVCEATKHIKEQIALVKKLEVKGFTYKTSDGVYFDTSEFKDYGKLAKLNIEGLQAGKRIELGEKKNKTDFALWKFSKPDEKRDMEWDSPWGIGFPGWHIECSAMSMKYLGDTFDIHTGGIDHIPIHHTNEIAQAECATGKQFVKYWVHSEFLVLSDDAKMSKSLGNVLTVNTLMEKGYDPLAFRLLCLGTHYRKRLLFDENILIGALNTFNSLKSKIIEIKSAIKGELPEAKTVSGDNLKKFRESIFNDINTSVALAEMWGVIREDSLKPEEKYSLLLEMDKVLGLNFEGMVAEKVVLSKEMKSLLNEREKFRKEKNWKEADRIRDEILSKGFTIKDTSVGPELVKK